MVRPEIWWEYQPGQRVLTREGIAGTVDDVVDGPGPGNETYLVTLDAGLGGGEYGSSELAPLAGATAAVDRTAADDYPTLDTVLHTRLPPAAIVPVAKAAGHFVDTDRSVRLEGLASDLLTEANADRWRPDFEGESSPYAEVGGQLASTAGVVEDPCRCCAGAGEHDNGHECIRCDASGRAEGAETTEPVPCAGKTAGWVRDLFRPPTAEHSYDWCRFRRDSHCWYPKGLDGAATRLAGYAVWTPTDRGRCPRGSWTLQEQCPLGAPGPNAGGLTDATTLETQRGGVAAGLQDQDTLSILRAMHSAASVDLPAHFMLPNTPEAGAILRAEVESRRGMQSQAALRPDQIIESRPIPGGWDDEEEHRVSCPEHGPGQHWTADWLNAMSWATRHLESEHSEAKRAALTTVAGHYRDAIKKFGGFTVKNRLGDGPATGYMVSPYKDAEETFDDGSFDDSDVDGYRERHAHQLAHPQAYLGAWHHEGKVYLDVSHRLSTEGEAHELARRHGQLAVYDLAHGTEIPTKAQTSHAAALVCDARPPVHAMLPATADASDVRTALGLPTRPAAKSELRDRP